MTTKVIVVVGATDGVGQSLCNILAAQGHIVIGVGRSDEKLAALQGELLLHSPESLTLSCDVRIPSQVTQAMSDITAISPSVDALVYCAGVGYFGDASSFDLQLWNETLETNLTGLFLWTKEVIPHLSDSSNLIAISSGAGRQGIGGLSAYCASKFGLMGFMESVAHELGPRTKVSTVVPGSIFTNWGEPLEEKRTKRESGTAKYLEPKDVAEAVIYILNQPSRAHTQEMNIWPH